MEKKGNSLLETRRKNRVLIKNSIFRNRNITRTEIAERLCLTKATITTSVNELLREGILEELPLSREALVGSYGRKPVSLAFRAEAGTAVGIELGAYQSRGVLMDMKGRVLKERSAGPANPSYEHMFRELREMIQYLLPEARQRFLGIGIGLPGFIDNEKGVILRSPKARWSGRALARELYKVFREPVHIDNHVRLRAIGQDMIMRDRGIASFAYFFLSRDVSCPMIVQNESLSGSSCGAGALGKVLLSVDHESGVCRSVDELASERALFERCQKLLLEGRAPELQKVLEQEGKLSIDLLLAMEEAGDEIIRGCFRETLRYAGAALANVVNLLNPELVVVDASILQNAMNRGILLEESKKYFYSLNKGVRLLFVPFHKNRGAVGAAYSVIQRNFLDR